jgi:hypothetical protein
MPSRLGWLVEAGPYQSEVRWDDKFGEIAIQNEYLRDVSAAEEEAWRRRHDPQEEIIMRPDFEALTNPQLTQAYNDMTVDAVANGLNAKSIKKFKTKELGVLRCDALYKAICEKVGDDYEVKMPAPAETTSTPTKDSGLESKSIIESFKFREGSVRENLLRKLLNNFGKMIPKSKLGDLVNGVSGIEWRIAGSPGKNGAATTEKLPFELRVSRGEKEKSYGLYKAEIH